MNDSTESIKNKSATDSLKSRNHTSKWAKEETKKLFYLITKHDKNWKKISEELSTKTPRQCFNKYNNHNSRQRKVRWVPQEDKKILEWVEVHGPNKWNQCSDRLEQRTSKQCRERWTNVLNPHLKRTGLDEQEQVVLYNEMRVNWSSWRVVHKKLYGRTRNMVKNFFYNSLKSLKKSLVFLFLRLNVFGLELGRGNLGHRHAFG